MRRYFGTDGIRGVANVDLTPELALAISRAAAFVLSGGSPRNKRIVIGRDPRVSGPMLEGAVIAGLTSAGIDAWTLGIVPTPAVALVTRALSSEGVVGGVMISASHNPVEDNGLKFFGADGFKLGDERELEIEGLLGTQIAGRPTHLDVGGRREAAVEVGRYAGALVAAGGDLSGCTIVVDAAFGSAAHLASHALERLGARVISINDEPDGARINVRCGATHLEPLRAKVLQLNAGGLRAFGVAFDGDADRALFIDETGGTVTGDHILYLFAVEKKQRGKLNGDAVVGTSMSNIGLEIALRGENIELVRADVGDRYVIDAMRSRDLVLGAEASGHVIDFDHGTTGDGPMTAVLLAGLIARAGSLHEPAAAVRVAPQLIRNVPCRAGALVVAEPSVQAAVTSAAAQLGGSGRIVVRPSGTEPVVRVMVEAQDRSLVEETAARVCVAIEEAKKKVRIPTKGEREMPAPV